MEKTAPVRRRRRQPRTLKPLRYALAAAAMLLALNTFFKISNIQVAGNVLYSTGEVLSAAGLRSGRSALLLRPAPAETSILRSLPCVSGVRVRLRLPDTVVIQVEESPAVASLAYDGQLLLLNRACKVVGTGDAAAAAGLIELSGLAPLSGEVGARLSLGETDSGKLDYLTALLGLLAEKDMLPSVTALDISNAADLRFQYEGRFSIRLGGQDNLSYKLDFLRSIAADLAGGETGTIDLSKDQEGHYIPT